MHQVFFAGHGHLAKHHLQFNLGGDVWFQLLMQCLNQLPAQSTGSLACLSSYQDQVGLYTSEQLAYATVLLLLYLFLLKELLGVLFQDQ